MSELIRVAVCDDEERAVTVISASVESVFKGAQAEAAIESFSHPEDLLNRMKAGSFDIVFLDISMPEMDGIELGKKVMQNAGKTEVVFVSSRMDRMFDTFQVRPFGFVRKNHFLEDIGEVITRYIESRNSTNDDSRFVHFKDKQGMLSIDVTHITYIECLRNTQIIHFDNSDNEQKLYSRMEKLEEELVKYNFLRVHKGYLVACRFIRRFDAVSVILTNGVEIPVGRSRRQESMDAYLAYIGTTGSAFIGK